MAPVTVEAMVTQALIRVDDVTDTYPATRGPMYRRIGIRQRQIFVRAAQVNPDYYGTDVTVLLAGGSVDLTTLTDNIPELIQRIEIADPGTSGYAIGAEVALITMTDPDAELAPRATFRNQRLTGVGADLTGVVSVKIWFVPLPLPMAATETGATLLKLDQPWDGLLEVDLAGWIVAKATKLDPAIRDAALKMFGAEAADLSSQFEAHLRTSAPTVQRFVSPLSRPGSVI